MRSMALALLIVLVGAGAAAAASTVPPSARNSVSVVLAPPTKPYVQGTRFSITLLATLKKQDKRAYLLSFIQHSLKPCEQNPNQELQRTLPTHGAYYHHEFGTSPYTTTSSFTAGRPGYRRVCAYLFKKPVRPGTKSKPLAVGTAAYQVVS